MADNTGHNRPVDVLRESYSLLSRLSAIPAKMARLPDPSTGVHPDGAINTEAADTADYAPETVRLMGTMPYLAVNDRHEMFFGLLPSTFAVTSVGTDSGKGHFRDLRELLNDAEMPPTAMRLTRSETYEIAFMYDAATKLMVSWKPIDDIDESNGYWHVSGASP